MPDMMKCMKIVNVYATFSLEKKKEETYVNGITANGNRMNNIHTFEYYNKNEQNRLTSTLNAYISPMVMAQGIIALTMSKMMFEIQYAEMFKPEIICICLRFFSLSFSIKLITEAGIRAKPIDTTNTMKIPFADACLSLSF